MKTIANYSTEFCNYEIVKIQNGYLIKIVGVGKNNSDYRDCVYNATREETFSQFKFLVSLGGGQINYDSDSISW